MKKTAKAFANIAFIKYWGKTDPKTRVPRNNSISMNLSDTYTITTAEFDSKLKGDDIAFIGENVVREKERNRVVNALSKIRREMKTKLFAKVRTKNNFPKATGIASSASGFASLAVAAFGALDYQLKEKELSIFCRTLSGTACRSVPSGFVEWTKGDNADNSYAYTLFPANYWDICDVIAIVTTKMKKVSSTDGHALADTSPLYETRLQGMDEKIRKIKIAMKSKNFTLFGNILETEALNMHAICLTSTPPVLYWQPTTIEIMQKIIQWRENSEVESFFTIDAGPTVHVICQGKDARILKQRLSKIKGVEKVTINKPTIGAHLINNHLF